MDRRGEMGKGLVHQVGPVFRIELLGHAGGIDNVTKKDRENPPFSLAEAPPIGGFQRRGALFFRCDVLTVHRFVRPSAPSILGESPIQRQAQRPL